MVEPTGYTALDLIGFTDRGDYDPTEYYVKNDLVHDGDDNIWKVLIDDTHGVTPAEGIYYTIFIRNQADAAKRIIAPIEVNPAANAHAVDTQLIYNNVLYDVTTAIAANDPLIIYPDTGYNLKAAPLVSSQIQALANDVGDLTDLDTTVKTDLVSAINECVVEIEESGIVKVTTPSFSSLPQTFTAIGIDGDYELAVDGFALVSPSTAMKNDWNITTGVDSGTGNGQITISGTFAGSTACTVKMSFTKPVKAITAS